MLIEQFEEEYTQVHGTQIGEFTSLCDYAPHANEFYHYRINLGDYATGDFSRIWFVNDHDVPNPDSDSYFANLRLFESAAAAPASAAGSAVDGALLLPVEFGGNLQGLVELEDSHQSTIGTLPPSSEVSVDMVLAGLLLPSSETVTQAIDQLFSTDDESDTDSLLEDDLLEVLTIE